MPRQPFQVLIIPYRQLHGSLVFGVLLRSDAKYWQFVAGGGEQGESALDAAVRETNEELGIVVEKLVKLDCVSSVPAKYFKDWPSWPGVFVIPEYSFGADLNGLEPRLSEEHDDIKWLTYEAAEAALHWPGNKVALWELNQRIHCGGLKPAVQNIG
jgi:dihydroneopterin triphosphate diphosphatase